MWSSRSSEEWDRLESNGCRHDVAGSLRCPRRVGEGPQGAPASGRGKRTAPPARVTRKRPRLVDLWRVECDRLEAMGREEGEADRVNNPARPQPTSAAADSPQRRATVTDACEHCKRRKARTTTAAGNRVCESCHLDWLRRLTAYERGARRGKGLGGWSKASP